MDRKFTKEAILEDMDELVHILNERVLDGVIYVEQATDRYTAIAEFGLVLLKLMQEEQTKAGNK